MLVNIGIPEDQITAPVLNAGLEAVTRLNEQLIRSGKAPNFKAQIAAGNRWAPEPPGQESFDHAGVLAKRGWGDCDDWAPLHAGSLRASGEDPGATAVVYKSGPGLWHAVTRRGNGTMQDPSQTAGMRVRPGGHAAGIPAAVVGGMSVLGGVGAIPDDARPLIMVVPSPTTPGAWVARTDMPIMRGTLARRGNLVVRKSAPTPAAALAGSILGAAILGAASRVTSKRHLDKLYALSGLLSGKSPADCATLVGADAVADAIRTLSEICPQILDELRQHRRAVEGDEVGRGHRRGGGRHHGGHHRHHGHRPAPPQAPQAPPPDGGGGGDPGDGGGDPSGGGDPGDGGGDGGDDGGGDDGSSDVSGARRRRGKRVGNIFDGYYDGGVVGDDPGTQAANAVARWQGTAQLGNRKVNYQGVLTHNADHDSFDFAGSINRSLVGNIFDGGYDGGVVGGWDAKKSVKMVLDAALRGDWARARTNLNALLLDPTPGHTGRIIEEINKLDMNVQQARTIRQMWADGIANAAAAGYAVVNGAVVGGFSFGRFMHSIQHVTADILKIPGVKGWIQKAVSLIPYVGPALSGAMGGAMEALEGGSTIDVAIDTAVGLIPIPPEAQDKVQQIVDQVKAIAHTGTISEDQITQLRSVIPDGIIRTVFDTLIHIVASKLHGRATMAVVTHATGMPSQVTPLTTAAHFRALAAVMPARYIPPTGTPGVRPPSPPRTGFRPAPPSGRGAPAGLTAAQQAAKDAEIAHFNAAKAARGSNPSSPRPPAPPAPAPAVSGYDAYGRPRPPAPPRSPPPLTNLENLEMQRAAQDAMARAESDRLRALYDQHLATSEVEANRLRRLHAEHVARAEAEIERQRLAYGRVG